MWKSIHIPSDIQQTNGSHLSIWKKPEMNPSVNSIGLPGIFHFHSFDIYNIFHQDVVRQGFKYLLVYHWFRNSIWPEDLYFVIKPGTVYYSSCSGVLKCGKLNRFKLLWPCINWWNVGDDITLIVEYHWWYGVHSLIVKSWSLSTSRFLNFW